MIPIASELKYYFRNRSQYSSASLALSALRGVKALAYWREHKELWKLDVYRNYAAPASDDHLLHHLTHRGYLIKGLSSGQRVRCVLNHYRFEESTFDSLYRRKVYLEGGLSLWSHDTADAHFSIDLGLAPRRSREGELVLTFFANNKALHYIGFSWVEGKLVGRSHSIVPFIARNQAGLSKDDPNLAVFKTAFRNNTPSFFCFSAMQGIAQALGIPEVVGAKSKSHVNYGFGSDFHRHAEHFVNAYDGFWEKVGGVEQAGDGYVIELPFYRKPLSEVAPKHRKQTATRRVYWGSIAEAVRTSLQAHVVRKKVAQDSRQHATVTEIEKAVGFGNREAPVSMRSDISSNVG